MKRQAATDLSVSALASRLARGPSHHERSLSRYLPPVFCSGLKKLESSTKTQHCFLEPHITGRSSPLHIPCSQGSKHATTARLRMKPGPRYGISIASMEHLSCFMIFPYHSLLQLMQLLLGNAKVHIGVLSPDGHGSPIELFWPLRVADIARRRHRSAEGESTQSSELYKLDQTPKRNWGPQQASVRATPRQELLPHCLARGCRILRRCKMEPTSSRLYPTMRHSIHPEGPLSALISDPEHFGREMA